jgi:hypothetical protein
MYPYLPQAPVGFQRAQTISTYGVPYQPSFQPTIFQPQPHQYPVPVPVPVPFPNPALPNADGGSQDHEGYAHVDVVAKESHRTTRAGYLSFEKDDVITVLKRVDDQWSLGQLNGQIGLFPVSAVGPLAVFTDFDEAPTASAAPLSSFKSNSPAEKQNTMAVSFGQISLSPQSPHQGSSPQYPGSQTQGNPGIDARSTHSYAPSPQAFHSPPPSPSYHIPQSRSVSDLQVNQPPQYLTAPMNGVIEPSKQEILPPLPAVPPPADPLSRPMDPPPVPHPEKMSRSSTFLASSPAPNVTYGECTFESASFDTNPQSVELPSG